ncbi:MAG TPA: NAD(P)-dependent oxidoreductase, partial [Candidatus Bathyarchaeia archaeon]|nr:NAD(P)-dependent oxidoreductase [Candidatus Bathyarchaeia archaeon]
MARIKPNLLIGTDVVGEENLRRLLRYSNVYKLSELSGDRPSPQLSDFECLLVFSWPKELTAEALQKMTRLRFIQSILAGVNHVPFADLASNVTVCSNAGAYSDEVAEYAWGLLLSAAKRIVELHVSLRDEKWTLRRTLDKGTEVSILKGKVLGILGFGGIGTEVARIARGFGMHVYAYSRKSRRVRGVKLSTGPEGLSELLKKS